METVHPPRDEHERHRLSFGPAAALYDRVRPSYPAEALRAAVGSRRARVVDLGAGTGLLTRALLTLGHDVIAVEPDPEMRARLAVATPGVAATAGSAEEMPLPDGSVDAVLAGQAYHWFDPATAHAEIARVLRPGGVFAPIWNLRDESVSWVRELWQIIDPAERFDVRTGLVERGFGPLFGPVRRHAFQHSRRYTVQGLVDLVRSRSYYLTAAPQRRREMEAAVRDLAAAHPDLRGRDTIELGYVTEVYRATRVHG